MKRAASVLVVLAALAAPVAWRAPAASGAGAPVTIRTTERGSGAPAPYACYALTDLPGGAASGGGQGRFCDNGLNGDDAADGTVVATPSGECDPCRVTQDLPAKPGGVPTEYLLEPPQEGPSGGTFTFANYLKPYLVVTARNAKTGKLVKGACIAVGKQGQGADLGACDGDRAGGLGDQDGLRNGRIVTRRLSTTGDYVVVNKSPFPRGYRAARPVTVSAGPAETGQSEAVVIRLRPTR